MLMHETPMSTCRLLFYHIIIEVDRSQGSRGIIIGIVKEEGTVGWVDFAIALRLDFVAKLRTFLWLRNESAVVKL
jgi:hypothetical protein